MVKRKNEAAKEVEQEPSKEGEEEAAMESEESAPAGRSGPPGGNPAVRGGLPPAGKVTKVNLIQLF